MNGPQSIRHHNEIRALNALFREGGMSRADLARSLGLNRSSIGHIVAALIAGGLVREGAETIRPADEGRTGRPGILVQLSAEGGCFLGIEIGIDRLSAVAIDLSARVVAQRSRILDVAALAAADAVEAAADLAGDLAVVVGGARIRGACLTLPAIIDTEGVVRNALMLGWRDQPVGRMLEARIPFAPEVTVENDANAFAIGEGYVNRGGRSSATLFLHIENGVGGGIVLGGRLFRGAHGFAGEFGHLAIEPPSRPARRGISGELETLIGKDAILDHYVELGGPPDFELLLAALAAGEARAARVAEAWALALGQGLAQLIKVFDPERIVLGGSVAPVYEHVRGIVAERLEAALVSGLPRPAIELSSLGAGGAAYGAACVMHQRMFEPEAR